MYKNPHYSVYEEERKLIKIKGKHKCKSEWCANPSNDNLYCIYCYNFLFPD